MSGSSKSPITCSRESLAREHTYDNNEANIDSRSVRADTIHGRKKHQRSIGQIIEALETSKYAGNTIIVLWSDHGFQLGEKERWGKYSLWERATRVNLLWVAPGVTKPGTVTNKPANLLDIYPTLASLTGCKPPEGQLEGNDLSVLMKDADAAWDEATVTTFGYKNYGVRSERYRYIVYENGTEELYDHAKDKWEWDNLAGNSDYAEVMEKLRKEIPTHHEPFGALQGAFERKRTRSKK